MNSMYGKTIIKPVGTYTIVNDNKNDFEKYTSLYYNYIGSVIEVNDTFHIKQLNQSYHIIIMFIVVLIF